jgi:Fe-S-cluster containining protein
MGLTGIGPPEVSVIMARRGGASARDALAVASTSAPAGPHGDVSICVGCGLCCDGTLFSHLGVTDESDLGRPLAAMGVTVIVEADPPVFALPCPAFDGHACTIYSLQRPRACGWFECDVSRAVAASKMSWPEAEAIIGATRALRDQVRAGEAPESELRAVVERHFRQH